MARRNAGLRDRKSQPKVDTKVFPYGLDYHEGLSSNQVKIILREFGFDDVGIARFNDWMYGQTCPVIERRDRKNVRREVCGIYEYDLFRWIENQKKGTPLIWD